MYPLEHLCVFVKVLESAKASKKTWNGRFLRPQAGCPVRSIALELASNHIFSLGDILVGFIEVLILSRPLWTLINTLFNTLFNTSTTFNTLFNVVLCVFFPFILDIKFVGRTSRGHTGRRSHRISHPPSFCGACLDFFREKDSAIPFPRRP